jgi:PhzF family phenazine biosynthesis protein
MDSMKRQFVQVDVFAHAPYRGNPLAVVVDADGLSTSDMQKFAKWTNLSETTFLLPPTNSAADYRVRIFTPTEELPFAGHPTLGSAHAWLTHGGTPHDVETVIQECKVGLIHLRRNSDSLAFAAPPLVRSGSPDESTIIEAADSLGIERKSIVDAAWVDNGPGWLGLLLGSAEEVLAIQPRTMNLNLGVAGAYPVGSTFAYEVRAFYSSRGVTLEDPVTGSLNASLAQWFIENGRFTAPYLASQGTAIGYAGVIRVSTDDSNAVWIGGNVTTRISGFVDL